MYRERLCQKRTSKLVVAKFSNTKTGSIFAVHKWNFRKSVAVTLNLKHCTKR